MAAQKSLDRDAIAAALSSATREQLSTLMVKDSVASTNQELLEHLHADQHGIAVLMAEQQTAGKGRHGKSWVSPYAENIYLSLAYVTDRPAHYHLGLSLPIGIAIVEALQNHCGQSPLRLKWPNDVVIASEDASGRYQKLSGVLIELKSLPAGKTGVVIGVGINIAMSTASAATIAQPWVSLQAIQATDVVLDRNPISVQLIDRIVSAITEFNAHGLVSFLPRYAALDYLHARTVQVSEGGVLHEGEVLGISSQGALRVLLKTGERLFWSGDVSVRPKSMGAVEALD